MDLKCTIDGHLLGCVPSISSGMGEGLAALQRREET